MPRSVSLQAFAKVNLHLELLGKRPDGYRELLTLFERIGLADEVAVERSAGSGVEFRCDSAEVPRDGANLAVRAAERYREASGWRDGVRIHLRKEIPVGGGLGGGSSDAAAVLLALQELSGGCLTEERLMACAADLGSDVPFFASRLAWALGRGRGEKIEPVRLDTALWHLLVTPDFSIPTRSVYEAFRSASPSPSFPPVLAKARIGTEGKLQRESDSSVTAGQGTEAGALTATGPDVRLLLRALEQRRISEARGLLFNALEPTVEAVYPAIRPVKSAIEAAGLARPCVSGSGATVFALCDSSAQAEEAAQRIRREHPAWRVSVCITAGPLFGRKNEERTL